jgi:hypothetical protein
LFTGHYSFSFAGKSADKRIPLWLLFLAVQWIDVMWSIFVLLGIEKVRIVPGITASNALDLYYMPAVLVGSGICGLPDCAEPSRTAHRVDSGRCGFLSLDSRPHCASA